MAPPATAGAFFAAVRAAEHARVGELLAAAPALVSAHDASSFGATALIHASGAGDFAMVDLLLEHGADLDQRSDWWAGSWGVLDGGPDSMCDELLRRGATLTVHAAARLGRTDQLRAMLDADPEQVHAKGGDGQRPLHFARTEAVADLLLERGADLEARDVDHVSTAAQWQIVERPEVARHLVERGAEVDPVIAAALGRRGKGVP